MSSVRVNLPLNPLVDYEVESSVFTTPGGVSPVAEYSVSKLLDFHVDLKQLSLKNNCLLKWSQVVIHLLNHSYEENILNPSRLHPQKMK